MHCVRWFAGRQETLCGLAVRQPWVHTHPSLLSQKPTTVDYMRRTYNSLVQFFRSSSGKFPPQYKSFASFDMKPAWIWSPNTRHKDSSRAVFEPGIPIAHLVYTRMLLQGVWCHYTSWLVWIGKSERMHLSSLLRSRLCVTVNNMGVSHHNFMLGRADTYVIDRHERNSTEKLDI